jgi:hypothetical protein
MRTRLRALVVALAATAAACQIRPTFTTGYMLAKAAPAPQAGAVRLAVRRFAEERPPRVYTTQGRAFLTYVPLLPYVSLPYERLDESVNLLSEDIKEYGVRDMPLAPPLDTYTYPVSIPRAIADDLAASGLFISVQYVGDGVAPPGCEYVLDGAVRASPLRSSATSFGLGIAGVLLWNLPIPMQKTTADISVDLVLTDLRSGQVVWRDTLTSEVSRIATIYNDVIVYGSAGLWSFNLLPLQPEVTTVDRHSLFSWHFEALRRAMAAAKPSLARALQ